MVLAIALLLAIILIAYCVWFVAYRTESFFHAKNIKFVRGVPVLGALWRSFFGLEHFTTSFEKIYKRFPNERIVGFYDLYNSPKYMIRDVELIKQIAIKDFDHFVNHSFYVDDINDPFFGRSFSSKITDWSDNDLLAQCMLFLLAGFGTVSLTLCFMVHEICVNPDVQERLYNEIQDVKSKLNGQSVTYEALKTMKYMEQVLQETMRRWPQTGFSSRLVNTPYVIENINGEKIHLNVGDVLVIPSNAIHADDKYYSNPSKFDPERFTDENKLKIPMGAQLAFGIGPRACIATRFASMECKACVSRFNVSKLLERTMFLSDEKLLSSK